MISKKEEERNEKIIRGLMKLPPNRNCINCDSLGPQYVCTNFWTFVCTVCSGIHREFTHRVKSVSMSKFTTQEVDALQKGGNQRAREQYLWEWDTRQTRLPKNSNPEKIREFIKNVYVDRKYYKRTTSDKPPRGASGEDDYMKASSYHSFSQSPPYDHQYEERRYGKQAGTLTRRPGSDRGIDGKISSFLYSPGRQGDIIFENKLANETTGSRRSDFSVSSEGQSLDLFARRISPSSQVEGTKVQKIGVASQLAAKEDSNKISNSANQGSLIDSIFELVPVSTTNTAKVDLFDHMPVQTQNNTSSTPFIDLFADINHIVPPVEEKIPVIPADSNGGWAIFDLQHTLEPPTQSKNVPNSVIEDAPKEIVDIFSSMHSNFDQFLNQKPDSSGQSFLATDQWPMGLNGSISSSNTGSTQFWDTLPGLHNNESQDMLHGLPSYIDPYIGFKAPEGGVLPIERKTSFNPFEVEPEANNMFMEMSSLQGVLPDPQLPAFPEDSFSNNWFQQDSITSFIPPAPQGSLAYTGGQLPIQHPQNITSQGSIPPLGGNPFA